MHTFALGVGGGPEMPWLAPTAELLRDFGLRLRAARARSGVTQAELATRAGVSFAYISMLERGVRNPSYTTVVNVARQLGVPAAALFPPEHAGGAPARRPGRRVT